MISLLYKKIERVSMKYIISKNNLNILIKLVFILILFGISINTVKAETISFNSRGGSDVSSIDIDNGDELGELPIPTRAGYTFDGWYLDTTYKYKVSSKTIVEGPMDLDAKWVTINFPYVYDRHTEEFTCDGSNYIDTGVKLYNSDNWQKDYEIGLTITEYNPTSNVNQAVFVNAKYENTSLKWPGLVFRRYDSTNRLELTQSINKGVKESVQITDWTIPYKIKIIRINKKVYYEINDGERLLLQDMSDFNQQFNVNTYFCAADNGSGGAQRFLVGKIQDYYIKMGTYEDVVYHTVTYPDGNVEVYEHNSIIQLGSNETTKPSEVISEVTFNPHNGESSTVGNVYKNYDANGFISGDVHYDDEATIFVEDDMVIDYDYKENISSVEFPSDPELEYFTFDGWYTEETGGEKITSYNGETDIELHAQYIPDFDDELESDIYDITNKNTYRIISSIDSGTLVSGFKDNMGNPNEYIKVFNNDIEVLNTDRVRTGLTVKLIVGNNDYDEAITIVRGDINDDSYVNIKDYSLLNDHLLPLHTIDDYRYYAADVNTDSNLNVLDSNKLSDYILRKIDSLNN